MKINPVKFVKSLYYANRPLNMAKPNLNPRVQVPLELDDYIYNQISSNIPLMESLAEKTGRQIRFAQKGKDLILMNFGPFTRTLKIGDLSNLSIKLYEQVAKMDKAGIKY